MRPERPAAGTSSRCWPTRCGRSSRPSGSRAGSRRRFAAVTRPPPRSSPTGPRSSRSRAAGAARSAQLGAAGGRGRRRRRRHRGAGPARAAPPQQAQERERPTLASARAFSRAACRRRREQAEQAEDQRPGLRSSRSAGRKPRIAAPGSSARPQTPSAVEQARRRARRRASAAAGEQQPERPERRVEQVEPGVDPEAGERVGDFAGRAEGGAVEEADDAEHEEQRAGQPPRRGERARGSSPGPPSAAIVGSPSRWPRPVTATPTARPASPAPPAGARSAPTA